MDKAYLASPIFTPQHLSVVNRIASVASMGHWDYFSPYEQSRPIWNGRAPKDCTPEERKAVVEGNIAGLRWADVLVAWTGGHQHAMASADTGTVWEMGYFKALMDTPVIDDKVIGAYYKRPRFTIAYIDPRDMKQNLNLMLAETIDSAVYGTAQLSQALDMLRSNTPKLDMVRETFHPSKLVLHERDPLPERNP